MPSLPAPEDTHVQRMQQMQGVMTTQSGSAVVGAQQATATLYGMMVRQATVMAYIDVFRLLAFLCVLCIPAALLVIDSSCDLMGSARLDRITGS